MRINFIVEDSGPLQYLGCATAAKNLYNALSESIDISYNDTSLAYDLCHLHTFGPRSLLYLKRFKGKKIITAHSTPQLNEGNLAFPRLVNWLYTPIYNQFDHIIAVSKKCEHELKEMGCNKPISTIYNGIDIKKFRSNNEKRTRFREHYHVKENDLVVLTVAQRTPRKGIYDFLALAKRFPEKRFIWIGGFPYGLFSKDFRKVTTALQHAAKNTFFPGFVEDIFEVYSGADVFLMPSYAEGHSIVMLEALAMGLPMIARRTEEYIEAFSDMIYYYDDILDITEDVFSENHLLKFKRKTYAVQRYNINDIARQHVNLYQNTFDS